jgi:hypothetical protein
VQYPKGNGLDDSIIVTFTTDTGPQTFSWPKGGQTLFYAVKGKVYGGGFRCPAMIRGRGKVPDWCGEGRYHLGSGLFCDIRDRRRQPERCR